MRYFGSRMPSDSKSTQFTPDTRQSKTLILLTNVDRKSIDTEFSIADWRQMAIVNTVSRDFCSACVDC